MLAFPPMRLRLSLPPGASERPVPGGGVEVTLREHPWLRIAISPLAPAWPDRAAWLHRLLAAPPGGATTVLGSAPGATTDGWPYELIDAVVNRGDALVEHRLIATYELLDHAAAVIAHATDTSSYRRERATLLLPLAASAHPDWRTRSPVALADLWSLD